MGSRESRAKPGRAKTSVEAAGKMGREQLTAKLLVDVASPRLSQLSPLALPLVLAQLGPAFPRAHQQKTPATQAKTSQLNRSLKMLIGRGPERTHGTIQKE